MYSVKDLRFFTVRVSPFGNLRVIAYFQLTAAYRRLSRPSSALSAKAFTLRSFSLEQPSCSSPDPSRISRNNFSFFAWASQIIVLGCNLKRPFGSLNYCVRLEDFSSKLTKLFPLLTEKPISVSITSFSRITLSFTTICSFHNFLIRFSMNACVSLFKRNW